jgi:hypothetical protein
MFENVGCIRLNIGRDISDALLIPENPIEEPTLPAAR